MFRRAHLILAVAVVAGCGAAEPEGALMDDYVDHDLGVITSDLTAGQAGGCDTSIVSGLTQQLVAELNCIVPNSMTSFLGPNISVTSAVNPFLAPAATTGLKAAVAQRGVTMGISSAYRSVAQQYLLYKWWKAGQCGIQIAAVPGNSNHQSGRAVDVPSYSSWISAMQAHGWAWYGSGDVVHFDFNGAANLGGASVLAFQRLWNKNNSNKLAEDGQWGPASATAMSNSPTTGFNVSGCSAAPPPPPPATDGTLKGRIYKLNPADPADLSQGIGGATVKVSGKTLTTDGTGLYSVALPAGAVSISASATGFTSASLTRSIVSGQTVWGSIPLTAVGTPDTQKPDVEIVSPLEGAVLEVAAITVTGTASDDRGTLSSVSFTFNSGAPIALAAGAFSQAVTLKPGANLLVVEAVDPAGNTTRLERKVSFPSGVSGVVTAHEQGLPLDGVDVRLLDASGAVLASGRTAADGSYAIDAAPGSVTLVANLAGRAEYRQPVEISKLARTTWSFSLSAGIAGSGVRVLYPREGEAVLTATLYVSGVVDGFVPAVVRVNGVRAKVIEGNAFTVEVPLEEGDGLVEVVAAKDDGSVFTARVPVVRLNPASHEEATRVRGGCSAAPGPWLLAGALLLGLARRRRSMRA